MRISDVINLKGNKMSIWTHVNGSIRIDGLNYSKLPKIWKFDVPTGSEGGIEFDYKIVGVGAVLAVFNLWGDLRDYENVDEIINWIETSFKDNIIRSGIVEIDCEASDYIVLLHHYNCKWNKIKIKKEY